MAHAAYDGIFLAPESIVTLPGAALSDFDGFLQADRAGVRAERFAVPAHASFDIGNFKSYMAET